MSFFRIIVFFFYFTPIYTVVLNRGEMEISLDLIKELEIRQSILVGDKKNEDLIHRVKELSAANIPTTHLNYKQSIPYISDTEALHFHTALIFVEGSMNVLGTYLQIFAEKRETYKLRKFVWIIFLRNQTKTFEMKEIMFPYDCELIVIQSTNDTTYKLTELYSFKNKTFTLSFGTWNKDGGLKATKIGFYRRRQNFQKTDMIVVSLPSPISDTKYVPSELYLKLIQTELANILNLTEHRFTVNTYIDYFEEPGFGDVIGTVYYFGRSDDELFDKVGPISKGKINWYVKQPPAELRPDYYLQPFDFHLWLVLLTVMTTGTIMIMISQNFIKKKKRLMVDNLFLGLDSFCNQCGNDDIQDSYLRFICILLRFIALLLMALYGAVITSFIAVEIFQSPFNNVEEFVTNKEYKLLSNAAGFPSISQTNKNSPIYKNIYANYTKLLELQEITPLITGMCQEKYTVIGYDDLINTNPMPCKLYKIRENFGYYSYGMILRKYHSLTRVLNKNWVRFHEMGFRMKFMKYATQRYRPENFREEPFQPIKTEQLSQVLLIPLIGIIFGTAILFIEIKIKLYK